MGRLIHKKALRDATPRGGVAAARQRAGQAPVRTSKNLGALKSKLVTNRDVKTRWPGLRRDNGNRIVGLQARIARLTKPLHETKEAPRPAAREEHQDKPKPRAQRAALPVIGKSHAAHTMRGAGKASPISAKKPGAGTIAQRQAAAIPNGPSPEANRGASRQNHHALAAPSTKSKAPSKFAASTRPSFFSALGSGIAHAAQAAGNGLSSFVRAPKQLLKTKQGERDNIQNAFDNVAEKGGKAPPDHNQLVPVGTKNNPGDLPRGKGGVSISDGAGKATSSRDAARGKPSVTAPSKGDGGLLKGPAPASPPPDPEDKSKGRFTPDKISIELLQQQIRWQRQRRARTQIQNRRHDMQMFRRQRLGGLIDEMFGRNGDAPPKNNGAKSKDSPPKNLGKPAPKAKLPDWKLEDFFNPIRRPSGKESPILLVKSGVSNRSATRTPVTEASKHLKDHAREEANGVSTKPASSGEKPAPGGFMGRFVNGVQNSVRDSLTGLSESFYQLPMVQNFTSATDQAPSRLEPQTPLEELSGRGEKEDSHKRLLPPLPCKRSCCHR